MGSPPGLLIPFQAVESAIDQAVRGGEMIRRAMQVGAGLALGAGGVALAIPPSGAAPPGGAVQLWGTPSPSGGGGRIVFTGAIADSGGSASANSSGKPDKNGSYKLLSLKKGTILVNTTQLNKDLNNPNVSPTNFNTTTCSGYFNVTDPVPIVSGTKLYAGASGSVTVTVTFAAVIPLQKGKCPMGNNGPNPVAQYGAIAGMGTVSF